MYIETHRLGFVPLGNGKTNTICFVLHVSSFVYEQRAQYNIKKIIYKAKCFLLSVPEQWGRLKKLVARTERAVKDFFAEDYPPIASRSFCSKRAYDALLANRKMLSEKVIKEGWGVKSYSFNENRF